MHITFAVFGEQIVSEFTRIGLHNARQIKLAAFNYCCYQQVLHGNLVKVGWIICSLPVKCLHGAAMKSYMHVFFLENGCL